MIDDTIDEHVEDEELRALAHDGRVTCARALEFARVEGVSPAKIGRRLTSLGIKIVDCQLGCFGRHRTGRG